MADYIHRCGRTGRVGSDERSHVSNLIVSSKEVELVQKIEVCGFIVTDVFGLCNYITYSFRTDTEDMYFLNMRHCILQFICLLPKSNCWC
jgi:hypothetical protein